MAGWLDGLFDPATYQGGAQPGWLGALLQSQPGPSQGFPGAPNPMASMSGAQGFGAGADLPPTAAPTQGQGMPQGGLQMPQQSPQGAPQAPQGNPLASLFGGIGNGIGSMFGGGQGQPQGQAGQAQPQSGQAQPQSPGMLDRLTAGANSMHGNNIFAAMLNGVNGLATGQRTDPQGIALANQRATMQAIVPALMKQPGMDLPTAMGIAQSAAVNPEVLKTIAPQLYSKPEFKTIKNALGEDVPIFANADKQTITYPGASGGGAAGEAVPGVMQAALDKITAARDAGVPVDQLIKMIPNSLQGGVDAMLQGKALPNNLSMRGSARDNSLKFAHAIDNQFDETTLPARVALQKSYSGGGKDFQEVQALNTVAGHMSKLMNSAEGLGNTGFKPWNWLVNEVQDNTTGSPALVKFRNDLVTTQNELAKAYHGGHVSDSAYNAFSKAIGESQTPAELKAAIGELSDLLSSKIEAKAAGYRTAMKRPALPEDYSPLYDEAQKSFQRINKWAGVGSDTAPAGQQQQPQQHDRADLEAEARRRGLIK
jgi:hypothetical protein